MAEGEWEKLQREVTEWEPREALLAGPDGLDVFRSVIPALAPVAGTLALEIGRRGRRPRSRSSCAPPAAVRLSPGLISPG